MLLIVLGCSESENGKSRGNFGCYALRHLNVIPVNGLVMLAALGPVQPSDYGGMYRRIEKDLPCPQNETC